MHLHHCTYRCVGTVTQYCGSSDEHFVVFDEDCLQSQWMVITADSTDVLLGGEEERKAGDERLRALHHFGLIIETKLWHLVVTPTLSGILIPTHPTPALPCPALPSLAPSYTVLLPHTISCFPFFSFKFLPSPYS